MLGCPSAIKRVLRHPQLKGLGLWSAGHLCLNGDSKSLLLFGCPPPPESLLRTVAALLSGEEVELPYELLRYD